MDYTRIVWELQFELVVIESIVFAAMGLFIYWTSRAILLLRGTEAEVNQTLERDLEWAHSVLRTLRMVFAPRYLATL
jgi:hypothetical protein